MRTVNVKYTPKLFSENAVRFEGETFGDLLNRLVEARVPGVTSKSYMEVFVPNEGYVCLLPDEALPLDKRLEVYVTVEQPNTQAQGVPTEPVTGQPVLPTMGAPSQPERGILAEVDWRLARKREKLNRKLSKITAKLEGLSNKHLGSSATSRGTEGGDSAGKAEAARNHRACGSWGSKCAAMRAAHAWHGHSQAHVPSGYAPAIAHSASRGDPSGANCPAEVVNKGKA